MRTTKLLILSCALLLLSGCGGADKSDALDPFASPSPASSSSPQSSAVPAGEKTIRIGMTTAQVSQALGQPDSVGTDTSGKEVWTYERKRAEFVYTTGQELFIGGYMSDAQGTGPLTLIIVLDAGRKVANFTYTQMPF